MRTSNFAADRYAPDFELPGTDGAVHHLSRYLERFQVASVVMMSNCCPYVGLYLDRLKQIQMEFQGRGLVIIGINANDDWQFPEESLEKMKTFLSDHQLNFPYLRDVTQEVAQGFGAERTPEVFLIDRSGLIRYRGAIDDSPQDAGLAKIHHLKQAIIQLLTGVVVVPKQVNAVGSLVTWRA